MDLSLKPTTKDNNSTYRITTRVNQSCKSSDFTAKIMEIPQPSSEDKDKENIANMYQTTPIAKVKQNCVDIEDKSRDVESSMKGMEQLEIETLPCPVKESETKNGTEKGIESGLQTSSVSEGLEFENSINSVINNDGKDQEESADCIEKVQVDHTLESNREPGLKECSKSALTLPNSKSAAQDLKKDEDSDTVTETASLLGMSEGPEVDNSESNLNISKLHPLPENSTVPRNQGGLKRVYKYSKSAPSMGSTCSEKNNNVHSHSKSESSISATSSEEKSDKSVGFANISIRNYSMTLGDHPDCSYGPPICLSWDYEDFMLINLDDYEENRPERRTLRQMLMNYYHRKHILIENAGFKEIELKNAVKQKDKAKRQRNLTRALLPIMEVETVVESVRRKCKRVVRKSDAIKSGTI